MKLFAISILAFNPNATKNPFGHIAQCCTADSRIIDGQMCEPERVAAHIALDMMEQAYPAADGWVHTLPQVTQVPDELIVQLHPAIFDRLKTVAKIISMQKTLALRSLKLAEDRLSEHGVTSVSRIWDLLEAELDGEDTYRQLEEAVAQIQEDLTVSQEHSLDELLHLRNVADQARKGMAFPCGCHYTYNNDAGLVARRCDYHFGL